MSIDAGLQVLLVGSGASLGREGAPRQLAAALGDFGTTRLSLTARDREILLACAAGAGLGGGVQRAAGRRAVRRPDPARHLASPRGRHGADHVESRRRGRLPGHPSGACAQLAGRAVCPTCFVFLALAIAPLAAAVGLAFNRLMATARPRIQRRSWVLIPAIAAAGLLIGICSIWWPELPGNGKSILTVSVNSDLTLGAAAIILLLKPLLTALFLRAGAVGGMLTPALATGAAAGSVAALVLNQLAGTSIDVSAVSLTCAAGVLAITQRSPMFAALFVWELARPPYWLLVVFAVAAYAAHGLRVLRDRHANATAEP